jgi:SAM-dependent methyltransferase
MALPQTAGEKTISDFGEQWTLHRANEGFYGSAELLRDIVHPFLTPADIKGKRCAEIGAGTGRIPLMLVAAGAGHVTAVEPSEAYHVLVANTAAHRDRIECLHLSGEKIPAAGFDLVLSIGVIHHIPEPKPVLDAAYRALREGGRILIWVYGREGNGLYLSVVQPIRAVTRRLPIRVNELLAATLYYALLPYALAAARLRFLPLSGYLSRVFMNFGVAERKLVILDQLNPEWARYYRREEAERLLADSGFADVRSHHRHGYSWTLTGVRLSSGTAG